MAERKKDKTAKDYYKKNPNTVIRAVKAGELSLVELEKLLKNEAQRKRKRKTVMKAIKDKITDYETRIKKIRAEPIIKVKHEKPENTDNKILGGVSQAVSDATGINVEVIRILFLVSFVFLIGIPVYALLSLFIKEN